MPAVIALGRRKLPGIEASNNQPLTHASDGILAHLADGFGRFGLEEENELFALFANSDPMRGLTGQLDFAVTGGSATDGFGFCDSIPLELTFFVRFEHHYRH